MATSQQELGFVFTAAGVAVVYSAYRDSTAPQDRSWDARELVGVVLAAYLLRRMMNR